MYSNNNENKITWSTGIKQTIRMTKSPLTLHGIILLQTADDRNALPTEQTSAYLIHHLIWLYMGCYCGS
jgi:hypothetical protein